MADPALDDNLNAIIEQLHEIGARNILILRHNRNGSQTVILTAIFTDHDPENAKQPGFPDGPGSFHRPGRPTA